MGFRFPPQQLPYSHRVQPSLVTATTSSSGVTLQPWESFFPFGVYETCVNQTTFGTDTITPFMAKLKYAFNSIFWGGHSLWNHELGHPHTFQTNIAASSFPTIKQLIQETGKWDATDPPDSIANGWFGDTTHDFTTNAAASFVANTISFWATSTTMLGWNVLDDATDTGTSGSTTGQTAQKSLPLLSLLQTASGSRVSTTTPVTPNAVGIMNTAGSRVLFTYRYPFGTMKNDGTYTAGAGTYVVTNEGDMHSSRNSNVGSHEWVDEVRFRIAQWDDSKPVWMAMQTHDTSIDGTTGVSSYNSSTVLRYPTANEMREYVWTAIGEGIKGFFFFTWSRQSGTPFQIWTGFSTRSDVLVVIQELSVRLTQSIRDKIVRTKRDTTAPFTVTGGGNASNNYTNGYVSTLIDRYDNTRYVVTSNRSLSTTNLVVTSGSLSGSLYNLETGQTFPLGSNLPHAALDGTIYKFIPA